MGGEVQAGLRVVTRTLELATSGHTQIVDITNRVANLLAESGLKEGLATIFSVGSTTGVTTVEYEPGLMKDLQELFEKLAPEKASYKHEEAWHDGNGYAHVRSSLCKTSLPVPFTGGKLILGTWQQIVFIDFDNRTRQRQIVAQFIGE
jgi:secondary thiamine-phosphate synthase enzyme